MIAQEELYNCDFCDNINLSKPYVKTLVIQTAEQFVTYAVLEGEAGGAFRLHSCSDCYKSFRTKGDK